MCLFGGGLSSSITSRFPGLAKCEGEVQTNDSCSLRTTSDELSDEHLILNICKGDLDALASLFRRYAHIVRGVAYRVLRDASEADDLVQDIFVLDSSPLQNLRQFQSLGTILDSANDLSPRHFTAALSQFSSFLYASGTR